MENTCNPNSNKPTNTQEGFFPDYRFSTHFDEGEAFTAALVVAAVSGGNMSPNQRLDLFDYLNSSEVLQKTPKKEVSKKMAHMFLYLEESGFEDLFDQVLGFYIQTYDSSLYEDACKVIHLIKNEEMEESQFLDELRVGLGLTDIEAWEIHAEIRGAGDFPLAA